MDARRPPPQTQPLPPSQPQQPPPPAHAMREQYQEGVDAYRCVFGGCVDEPLTATYDVFHPTL